MLRRGVEADGGDARQANHRAVLQEEPSLRLVLLAEERDRALRDVHRAPEVDFEERARDVIRHSLVLADRDVASVVEHDIDAPESDLRLHERGVDVCRLRDVELHDEEAVRAVFLCEVVERSGFPQRRDDLVAALEGLDDGLAAEAG